MILFMFKRHNLKQLGVLDNVSSPTFSLVNEYHATNKEKVYHFDHYRGNDSSFKNPDTSDI